jgi:hypothetical protein
MALVQILVAHPIDRRMIRRGKASKMPIAIRNVSLVFILPNAATLGNTEQ